MKTIIIATGLTIAASTYAWADGPSDPIVVPVMGAAEIEAATSSGGDNWVGIMMTILLFGTALAS